MMRFLKNKKIQYAPDPCESVRFWGAARKLLVPEILHNAGLSEVVQPCPRPSLSELFGILEAGAAQTQRTP
jgi:hypothetical protein